jgi:hypothetical protein
MRKTAALAFALMTVFSVPALSKDKDQPKLSAIQLQQIQTHEVAHPYKMVFAATLSVLQDLGYVIKSGDIESGLITAEATMESKITWITKVTTKQPNITAVIEPASSDSSKVRLNFIVKESQSSGGQVFKEKQEVITDMGVYKAAFEKIDAAAFLRSSIK